MKTPEEFAQIESAQRATDAEILAQLNGEKHENGNGANAILGLLLAGILVTLPVLGFMVWRKNQPPAMLSQAQAGAQQPLQARPIVWYYTMQEGLNAAALTKKPLIINVYTNWCGACKWMDANTFSDPFVQNVAQNYIAVKIDAERFPEVAQHYGVRAYPTTIWADGNGVERFRERGGISAAKFVRSSQ